VQVTGFRFGKGIRVSSVSVTERSRTLIGARIYAALSDTYWRSSKDVSEALAVHGIRITPRSIQRDLVSLAPMLDVDRTQKPFLWRRR